MKKLIYNIIIGLFLWLPAIAQQGKAEIESVKAAFITQKLDLTAEESQKFWPIYNNYQQELKQLIMKRNQQRRNFKQTGAEPVDELKLESEILELRKRYRPEFEKALPHQKAILVYPAEREFRQQLLEHLKNRKHKN